MKIALCFAGQPRCVASTYEKFIKPNILDCNSQHQIDVYIHAWFDKSMIGQSYVNAGGNICSDVVPENIIDQIYQLYSPKAMVIQQQKTFSWANDFFTNKYPGINPEYSISRMYSTNKVFSLLADSSDNDYDIIMVGRFDWAFLHPIVIDSSWTSEDNIRYPGGNPHGINIGWLIGTPGAMWVYSDLLHHSTEIYKWKNVPFVDELLAQKYLEMENIKVIPFDASYAINKGNL